MSFKITAIVGESGEMTEELIKALGDEGHAVIRFSNLSSPEGLDYDQVSFHSGGHPIAICFGGRGELGELMNFCNEKNIPLVQGVNPPSKDGEDEFKISDLEIKVPVIVAPNTILQIVTLLSWLPRLENNLGRIMKSPMPFSVVESHDKEKGSPSRTASTISRIFNSPDSNIVSIQDPKVQRIINVDEQSLDKHEHCFLNLSWEGLEISISTKVNGLKPYALGAIDILQKVLGLFYHEELTAKIYTVEEILALDLGVNHVFRR